MIYYTADCHYGHENVIKLSNRPFENLVEMEKVLSQMPGENKAKADKILETKGVIIVPDILANAGGVTVSYFEWVQNLQFLRWEEDEINSKLNVIMCKAFEEVYAIHKEKNIPLRGSAYILALKKLATTKKFRGVFP